MKALILVWIVGVIVWVAIEAISDKIRYDKMVRRHRKQRNDYQKLMDAKTDRHIHF